MSEASSEIGKKFILWKCELKSGAYSDQFGRKYEGYVVLEEIPVTVIEEKMVKGMWREEDKFTGIKAISSNGEEFTRHWNSYPDNAMNPNFYWDCREDKRGLWLPVDAIAALNFQLFPYITPDGKMAIPADSHYCDLHNKFCYDSQTCFYCVYMEPARYASTLMGKPWACDTEGYDSEGFKIDEQR